MDPIKITVGGDLCLANDPLTIGYGLVEDLKTEKKYHLVENLRRYFAYSDLSIINLESPISDKWQESENAPFLSPPIVPKLLVDSGIDIVNIANNHILEHGKKFFDITLKLLKSSNIDFVGVSDKYHQSNILIKSIKNKKIGIAAFNAVHDFLNDNIYADYSRKSVSDAISKMKGGDFDLIILVFHWGNEYVNVPSLQQIEDAHLFIDQGANLIIGHHPHVLQPIECYNKGVIIYSLGNLFFDHLFSKKIRKSLIVDIIIEDGEITYEPKYLLLDKKVIFREMNSIQSLTIEKRINTLYKTFLSLEKHNYQYVYKKLLKKNHFRNRMFMKLFLVKLFFTNPVNGMLIIHNYFHHIQRKHLKNEV